MKFTNRNEYVLTKKIKLSNDRQYFVKLGPQSVTMVKPNLPLLQPR